MKQISESIFSAAVCVLAVVCSVSSFTQSAADEPSYMYKLPNDNDHSGAAVTIVECIAKVQQLFSGLCRSESDTIALLATEILIDLKEVSVGAVIASTEPDDQRSYIQLIPNAQVVAAIKGIEGLVDAASGDGSASSALRSRERRSELAQKYLEGAGVTSRSLIKACNGTLYEFQPLLSDFLLPVPTDDAHDISVDLVKYKNTFCR